MSNYILIPRLKGGYKEHKLGIRERITLSYLIYRNTYRAASIAYLAKVSGSKRDNIAAHLRTLQHHGYAEKNDKGQWVALENDHYFEKRCPQKRPNKFYGKYSFWRLSLPIEKPNVLAWVILQLLQHTNLFNKRQSTYGIASLLGASQTGVHYAIEFLCGKKIKPTVVNGKVKRRRCISQHPLAVKTQLETGGFILKLIDKPAPRVITPAPRVITSCPESVCNLPRECLEPAPRVIASYKSSSNTRDNLKLSSSTDGITGAAAPDPARTSLPIVETKPDTRVKEDDEANRLLQVELSKLDPNYTKKKLDETLEKAKRLEEQARRSEEFIARLRAKEQAEKL